MSAQNIKFSKKGSEFDVNKQPITKKAIVKRGVCKVSRERLTLTVMRTLYVVLQIVILKLENLVGIILTKMNRRSSGLLRTLRKSIECLVNSTKRLITILLFVLIEMAELMVHTTIVFYQILKDVLSDLLNLKNELCDIILTTIKNDDTRAVDRNTVARAAMTRIITRTPRTETLDEKNVTSSEDYNKLPETEKQMQKHSQLNINTVKHQSAAISVMLDNAQKEFIPHINNKLTIIESQEIIEINEKIIKKQAELNFNTVQEKAASNSNMLDDAQKAFIRQFINNSTVPEEKETTEPSLAIYKNKQQSNTQRTEELTKSDPTIENIDLVFPVISPSASQHPIDKLAKPKRVRFFIDEAPTEPRKIEERHGNLTEDRQDQLSAGKYRPTQCGNHRRGPTMRPCKQNTRRFNRRNNVFNIFE